MASYFEGEGWGLFDKLSPYRSTKLIIQSIPQRYQEAGLTTRLIGLKPGRQTFWYEDTKWEFSLDYFQPEEPEPSSSELVELSQVEITLGEIYQRLENITETFS